MSAQEYNKGFSFRLTAISYRGLCRYLSELPGLRFTHKSRFFWSAEDVGAEFTFRGHAFEIQTDGWDGALWIMTKDREAHMSEMQELREHIDRRALSGRLWRFLKEKVT